MITARRFKIIVGTLHGKTVSYTVCTLLDERKAVAIAAQFHLARSPDDQLYEIAGVESLTGDKPEREDITDRVEW
jgi:hypothetical protein